MDSFFYERQKRPILAGPILAGPILAVLLMARILGGNWQGLEAP